MSSANPEPTTERRPPHTGRHLRTLHRYVLSEIVRSFLICLLVLTVVLFAVMSVKLIHKGLNVIQLRGAAFALCLSFFPYLLPFAFMTGLVMAFGRLSADNEILAMRAVGVHLGRLLPPALLSGLVLSAAAWFLNVSLAPRFQRKLASMEVDIFRGFLKRLQALPSRIISFPAYDLFVGEVRGKSCRDIVLFHNRGGTVLEILRAEELRIELDAAKGGVHLNMRNCSLLAPTEHPPKFARQVLLGSLTRYVDMGLKAPSGELDPSAADFQDLLAESREVLGSLQSYPERLADPKKALKKAGKEMTALLIEYNARLADRQKQEEALQIEQYRLKGFEHQIQTLQNELKRPDAENELRAEIDRLAAKAEEAKTSLNVKKAARRAMDTAILRLDERQRSLLAETRLARLQRTAADLLAEIHRRLALSMAPLVLGIVAVPLGLGVTRKGFLTALALSFAFAIFVYYPLSLLGDMLSQYTQVAPQVFAWLPNLFALATGAFFLMRAFRR